jgi:hypothetical protein
METTKFSPDDEKFLQIFQLSCSLENTIYVRVYWKIIRVQCGIIFYHVCFTCAKYFAFCRSRIFVSWDVVANLKADFLSSHKSPLSSLRVHAWALSSNHNAKQLILIRCKHSERAARSFVRELIEIRFKVYSITGGPISEWMIRCCEFLTVFINKFIVHQNYSKNILKLVK